MGNLMVLVKTPFCINQMTRCPVLVFSHTRPGIPVAAEVPSAGNVPLERDRR
jgi:hypothetical protein